MLRRLQDELHETDADDSDYAPSLSDDDDDEEEEEQPSASTAVSRKIELNTTSIVFKKIDQPGDCPICLEDMRFRQHGIRLKCGHLFHKKCVNTWLSRDDTLRCPTCRTPSVDCAAPHQRSSRSRAPEE